MKKLILYILVSLAFLKADAQANAVCCPEKFELRQLVGNRECQLMCDSSFKELGTAGQFPPPNGPVQGQSIIACKNSSMTYLVIPNLQPTFTYTWVVTGGTVASPNPGNPVTINWGNVTKGSIVVTISNADGSCVRKIVYDICLLDKPVAGFTFSPSSPICINNLVQFNNTSVGGAAYFWDFGDIGPTSTSTDVNPQHTYTSTGTYVVTLVVKSKSNGCGCTDTVKQTIVVNDGPGISGCDKMLCPGDTATYCSTKTCSGGYSWSVNGGTIIGSSTQNCVRVAWNVAQPGTLPATITLTTSGCGACNTTTLPVNVVWPSIPIQGNNLVCVGSTETYSLPVMPGTFYSWTLSGGGNIVNSGVFPNFNTLYPNGFPNNNPQINVDWTTPGNYTLTVNYNNPNTKKKCGGSYTLPITVKPKFKISGMTSVCAGTTGTYMTQDFSAADWTVTGGVLGTDYTFATGPNNVANFQVNWIASGVYQICGQPITANVPNYCNANPVCFSVIVKPTPVVTVGGSNLVCPGVLTNYVASAIPSGSNFLWTAVDALSTPVSPAPAPYGTYDENASIIFNGTAPWTVTASTLLNGCYGSANIIVNQVPVPTLTGGPYTTCIGGQITVGPATGTGPFTWSTSGAATLISPQGGSTATYEIHGTGTISVSNCSGPSAPINVTTTLPPSISIITTGSLCAGNLQLSVSPPPPGGSTYLWTGGSTGATLNVTIPGSYTVQVTYPGGCKSVATFVVAPVPLPTVTISTGDPLNWCGLTPSVNLQAFTLGVGCTYQWYQNGNQIFGATSSTYLANAAGSYYVVINCGGCVATSNTITVVYSPGPCGGGNGCTPVPPISNPISAITVTGCNPKTFSVTLTGCSGTVNWNFGDGGTGTGTTVTHTYLNAGVYGVTATVMCNGCPFTVMTNAQVPVKADFNSSVTCGMNGSNTINMNNTSQVLGGWTITSVTWSSTCGTPPTGSGNTYTLNTTIGCSPTVTMTITVTNTATGQTCTDTKIVPFTFASSPLSIIGPTTVCKDQTYSFSSSMVGILYQWTVNGNPVSQNNILSYAFSSGSPVLGLTVTDAFGCQFNTSVTLNVVTPPTLSITPSPIVKVCQAPCLTTGSVLTATPGFTNYEWFQNGVSLGAPSPSNTYTIAGPSPIGTYYVQAQSQPHLCNVKSNTVSVVYHPKPQARIIANTNNCIPNVPFTLNNASFPSVNANNAFNPNYNYEWFVNNLGTPIFNSNTTNFLTYTITTFGTYTFILRVTDVTTGCCNLDTICIAFSRNPTVSILPGGPLCEGAVVTLNATAGPGAPGSYYYAWENGQTGQLHTVQAAGVYSVMAMDNFGCAATNSVTIKPLPYVALFPQGCDTICLGDTSHLYFPLPTNISGQPAYIITWSPGGVGGIVSPFTLGSLGLGPHTITASVSMNGCTAPTAAYNVFIKNCDTCNCKESYWKDGPWWTNINTGEQTKIDCKKAPFQYVIQGDHCKDSFMVSGTYICKGTNCPGKVVISLYNANTNNYIGGGPGSYTIPSNLPNGSYYITIYAYCGDLICDSCKINIKKDCDKGCDCNKPGVELIPELTINNATQKLKCNGEKFEVNCLSNVTLNASYFCVPTSCPATITYQLTGPISQTGSLPLSLSGLPAGSYSIIIMAYCGGKLCKECKLNFEVICEKDCCPYPNLAVTLDNQTTSMSPGNTHLLVTQGFNFTGLTGASLTEIRAEVLSYNLTSQFPEQCIGCKNLPKGWASIYNGNVMGPVIPKVNLAGVMTNAPLNVTSLSAYSNPREIVWNNGGAIFGIVQPVTLGFILPKPSPLECCDIVAEICVKFTFRDKNCKECEVIACFKVVIKKK